MTDRVLVACVGNVLRCDDGFGVAVARKLMEDGGLPPDVDVIETGTGGLSIVQQLMDKDYQALVIVDAADRGETPGTIHLLAPVVADPSSLPTEEWRACFSNLHLAEPSRVFLLAKAVGVLPRQVLVVGCQPQDCESLGDSLSPPVEAAVEVAAAKVRELVSSPIHAGHY